MTATETKRDQDAIHLRRALELAERGRGRVSPNPLVGAVIARGSEVIGEGWHAELGGDHAEVAAIADASSRGADLEGSTMFVTLEPCAHHGKTPPCTEAILATPIERVVIASEDPSEKASGRGPGMLRDDGREVELAQGAEATAARLLNQAFRKHSRTGVPLVTLKMASSLDGKVATRTGDSKWISGERSRALVHRWRAESDAVAVGIGTALADDALLTARDLEPPAARQPARVVFDSTARLPLDSKLVASIPEAQLYVVTGPDAPADRVEALRAAGAEVLAAELRRGARRARPPRHHQPPARGRPNPRRRLSGRRRDRRAAPVRRAGPDRRRRREPGRRRPRRRARRARRARPRAHHRALRRGRPDHGPDEGVVTG